MKIKAKFVCQECGYDTAQWFGKCPGCGQFNTFVEERVVKAARTSVVQARLTNFSAEVVAIEQVQPANQTRYVTGINEFDRILGGGVVPGSLVLIGGDPGIGKSTLMLQVADALRKYANVLYVSGEESLDQLKLRAERLGVDHRDVKNQLFLLTETNLETIVGTTSKTQPGFIIIDSIQTMFRPDIISAPGSVGQVRECTAELLNLAKANNITVFVLGHVTKDGAIAGPRVLEHLVDTVLYFEAEKFQVYRMLRAYKNRFGATNELGMFEMTAAGLKDVSNPSEIFLNERTKDTSGTMVIATIEGTRPILLELQALVTSTSFAVPRRMVSGLDYNRMVLLTAVLEKRLGLNLEHEDVFINVVGGVKVKEPAADLGAAVAIASALLNFVCPNDVVAIGEVGLGGEIRSVTQVEDRVREVEKLGFKKCIIPKSSAEYIKKKVNIEVIGMGYLYEVIEYVKTHAVTNKN
ncbi:MAG: DNA repair protein RadA [Elusimicrobiota bacterium]